MDNCRQEPGLIVLNEYQPQISPIHPAILRIKTGKIILDHYSVGVNINDVVDCVS